MPLMPPAPDTPDALLLLLLVVSLVVWVGGALTGQLWMARAQHRGDAAFAAGLVPWLLWTIPRVYIPASLIAVAAGSVLALRHGVALTTPWVLFPLLVYAATVVTGTVYSLPEYRRLAALAGQRDPRDPELQRRIATAAWVNRVELLLVLLGLAGLITRPALG